MTAIAKGKVIIGWTGLPSTILYTATCLLATYHHTLGDAGLANSFLTSGQSLPGVELLILEPIAVYQVLRNATRRDRDEVGSRGV